MLPPLVAHALLNTITFAAAPFVRRPARLPDPEPWLGALLLLGGAAAAVLVFRALRRRRRYHAPAPSC